jgi:hypothetical protein
MALKGIVTKAEHEGLDIATKAFYKPSADGTNFVIDVDGGYVPPAEVNDLKTKLGEFRDYNRAMHGELEQLRPLKTKYEGIDPEEVKRLKALEADMKAKGVQPDKVDEAIKTAVAAATKPLADALESEQKARKEADARARKARFDQLVEEKATAARVKANARKHVLREAEQSFELNAEGTALVPRQGVKHPTEPHKDLTPDDWMGHLAKTEDFLFEQSSGGGATGGGGRLGQPGAKELVNPTSEEMGAHAVAIAKGEMVVVRRPQ